MYISTDVILSYLLIRSPEHPEQGKIYYMYISFPHHCTSILNYIYMLIQASTSCWSHCAPQCACSWQIHLLIPTLKQDQDILTYIINCFFLSSNDYTLISFPHIHTPDHYKQLSIILSIKKRIYPYHSVNFIPLIWQWKFRFFQSSFNFNLVIAITSAMSQCGAAYFDKIIME